MKIYAASAKHEFDKYLGKDLWVKVGIWNDYLSEYRKYYAKFIDSNEFAYCVKTLYSSAVEGRIITPATLMLAQPTWQMKRNFNAIIPVEILSGDEIEEIVNASNGEYGG